MSSSIKGSIKCSFSDIATLLRELPDKYIKSDVKAVQLEQWERVANAAREKVPVRTGRLKELIVTKGGYSKKNGTVFATVGLRKIGIRERNSIREKKFQRSLGYRVKTDGIEYDAYYGSIVEFGAPGHNQKPQPYMRPAFDNNFQTILTDFTAALTQRLYYQFEKLRSAPKKEI